MNQTLSISELDKSLIYIENSLKTSIGYEGDAPHLLIDEIQFLFSPSCVIIHYRDATFANVSRNEIEFLEKNIKHKHTPTDIKEINSLIVTSFNYNIDLIKNIPRNFSLRLVVEASNRLLSVEMNGASDTFKVDIYLNPESNDSLLLSEDFYGYIDKSILLVKEAFYLDKHPESHRLSSGFKVSPYLEIVFQHLAERIKSHIYFLNRDLGSNVNEPFFFQFFLMYESENQNLKKFGLRYYPLDSEIKEIEIKKDLIIENLEKNGLPAVDDPLQFISQNYIWESDRSFAGYAFNCGCSMYIKNWTNEPLAQAAHLSNEDKKDRLTATIIMQTLREDTPNIFVIPLYVSKQVIGVVLLNCPEDVEVGHRIEPIRSARSVGLPIWLALESDDQVNHYQEEKKKAAQVQAYKHSAQSIMHDERAYCMEIQSFLSRVDRIFGLDKDEILSNHWSKISYLIEEKLQLIDEFDAVNDYTQNIPPETLYPSKYENSISSEFWNIPIPMITELTTAIQAIFDRSNISKISTEFGRGLLERGFIPNLNHKILGRIYANLIKNSISKAKSRKINNVSISVKFDIIQSKQHSRNFLSITCDDNCGGFEDKTIPKKITYNVWVKYLNEQNISRGMGFLILSKYADSTKGSLTVSDITYPELGARTNIKIGLLEVKVLT